MYSKQDPGRCSGVQASIIRGVFAAPVFSRLRYVSGPGETHAQRRKIDVGTYGRNTGPVSLPQAGKTKQICSRTILIVKNSPIEYLTVIKTYTT
jgi:hypothetical protein